jgi:hypothetical protein
MVVRVIEAAECRPIVELGTTASTHPHRPARGGIGSQPVRTDSLGEETRGVAARS